MPGKVTEYKDGRISIITLNRPNRLNVLDTELMNELVGILETIEQDNSIRVIVLTGGDRVFSAGADLAGMMKNGRITIPKKSYLQRNIVMKGFDMEKVKEKAMKSFDVKEVEEVDGLRLLLDDAWVLFRVSGTEPKCRIYVESDLEERSLELMEQAEKILIS